MSTFEDKVQCEENMHIAQTYQEWKVAAFNLDVLEGHETWKQKKESKDYNYKLIELRLEQLRKCKRENDIPQMLYHLREGCHRNHGNIANPKLYFKCHVGTKHLIEEYIHEVSSLLKYLCDNEFEEFPFAKKIQFFDECSRSYGKSALLLSGGATFGLFHIGVIKALDEHGLIPNVVSGSSVGSVIAAGLATYSDLEKLYDPENLYLDMWKMLPPSQMIKERAFMDAEHLKKFLMFYADLTMEEIYQKTGRSLNVTVSPTTDNHNSKLLNHLNSPNLLGWSAIQASCAVPGIFPPVQLMAKDPHGNIVPYMEDCKWSDGALTSDLPMKRLAETYNVNHSIVSQVNPHVIPFISDKPDQSKIVGGIKRALIEEIKLVGKLFTRILQYFIPEKRINQGLELLHDVLDQKYVGEITIRMKPKWADYQTLFKNPSHKQFKRLLLDGERSTWPKLNMIYHQTQIGQTLENCVKKLEKSRTPNLHQIETKKETNIDDGNVNNNILYQLQSLEELPLV